MNSEKDKPVEPTHHVPSTRATNPAQIRQERPKTGVPAVSTPDGTPAGKRRKGGV